MNSLIPKTYEQAKERAGRYQKTRQERQKAKVAKSAKPQPRAVQRSGNSVSAKPRKPLRAKVDPKLVAWGKVVRERDGNQCVLTVAKATFLGPCSGRVDPHHVMPRGRRPDKKYDVDNGLCLCRTHHDWAHDNPIHAESFGLLSSATYEIAMKEHDGL